MYQCLKIKKVVKEPIGGVESRVFNLVTFLDTDAARTFTVYLPRGDCRIFEVGTSYDLHFQPTYNGLNFLVDEK